MGVDTASVDVRLGFLRKVFGIVSSQLLLTTIVSSFFMFHQPTINFVHNLEPRTALALLLAQFGMTVIIMIAMLIRQKDVPDNYILLTIFTILESLDVGVIVMHFTADSVLKALAITCFMTSLLTLYSMQTKVDFAPLGAWLSICLLTIIFVGALNVFLQSDGLDTMLTITGVVLFSLFIVFDVQRIMTKLDPDEYIVAAITLYLDIINLFIEILKLVGKIKNTNNNNNNNNGSNNNTKRK